MRVRWKLFSLPSLPPEVGLQIMYTNDVILAHFFKYLDIGYFKLLEPTTRAADGRLRGVREPEVIDCRWYESIPLTCRHEALSIRNPKNLRHLRWDQIRSGSGIGIGGTFFRYRSRNYLYFFRNFFRTCTFFGHTSHN